MWPGGNLSFFEKSAIALQKTFIDPYDEIDGVNYAKRGVEPGFWSVQTLDMQVRPTSTELRAREEKLDKDDAQRRERYHCPSFTTVDQLEGWESYAQNQIPLHRPKAQELEEQTIKSEAIMKVRMKENRQVSKEMAAKRLKDKTEEKKRKRAAGEEVSDTEEEKLAKMTDEEKEALRLQQERSAQRKAERKLQDKENADVEAEAKAQTKILYPCNPEINKKIFLWQGNICAIEADAIVNAANTSLLGGGGVDGAIHGAAGPWLYEECFDLQGCETGNTKITRGYNLPAKNILHTVGPVGRTKENEEKLASCYRTCLELVAKHGLKSVVFCGISTGIFGFPLTRASRIALGVIREWMEEKDNLSKVEKIILCVFRPIELHCYDFLMPQYFPTDPNSKVGDESPVRPIIVNTVAPIETNTQVDQKEADAPIETNTQEDEKEDRDHKDDRTD